MGGAAVAWSAVIGVDETGGKEGEDEASGVAGVPGVAGVEDDWAAGFLLNKCGRLSSVDASVFPVRLCGALSGRNTRGAGSDAALLEAAVPSKLRFETSVSKYVSTRSPTAKRMLRASPPRNDPTIVRPSRKVTVSPKPAVTKSNERTNDMLNVRVRIRI